MMAIVADQSRFSEGHSIMDPSGHIVRPSRTLALGAAVLASLLALSSTAAAGVVASESFETGLPSPSQQYSVDEYGFDQNTTGPASAPNVTFSGFSGIITNNFTTNSSGLLTPGGTNAFPNTTFGNQVAFLQSFQGATSEIDWAITGLHPGQEYVLSFEDVSSSIVGATPISVSAFGATPADYAPGASFTTETLDFTPSTANGSIDFIGIPVANNSLSAIDNLTISTASVPEPATWAMMLVGFGGLGAAMRARRRAAVRAPA
jgi:hypothetical protein